MLKNDYVTKLINLEGVKFKDIDIQGDRVKILVSSMHGLQLCPTCCKPTRRLVDVPPKVYRDVDLMGRSCYIEVDLRGCFIKNISSLFWIILATFRFKLLG